MANRNSYSGNPDRQNANNGSFRHDTSLETASYHNSFKAGILESVRNGARRSVSTVINIAKRHQKTVGWAILGGFTVAGICNLLPLAALGVPVAVIQSALTKEITDTSFDVIFNNVFEWGKDSTGRWKDPSEMNEKMLEKFVYEIEEKINQHDVKLATSILEMERQIQFVGAALDSLRNQEDREFLVHKLRGLQQQSEVREESELFWLPPQQLCYLKETLDITFDRQGRADHSSILWSPKPTAAPDLSGVTKALECLEEKHHEHTKLLLQIIEAIQTIPHCKYVGNGGGNSKIPDKPGNLPPQEPGKNKTSDVQSGLGHIRGLPKNREHLIEQEPQKRKGGFEYSISGTKAQASDPSSLDVIGRETWKNQPGRGTTGLGINGSAPDYTGDEGQYNMNGIYLGNVPDRPIAKINTGTKNSGDTTTNLGTKLPKPKMDIGVPELIKPILGGRQLLSPRQSTDSTPLINDLNSVGKAGRLVGTQTWKDESNVKVFKNTEEEFKWSNQVGSYPTESNGSSKLDRDWLEESKTARSQTTSDLIAKAGQVEYTSKQGQSTSSKDKLASDQSINLLAQGSQRATTDRHSAHLKLPKEGFELVTNQEDIVLPHKSLPLEAKGLTAKVKPPPKRMFLPPAH